MHQYLCTEQSYQPTFGHLHINKLILSYLVTFEPFHFETLAHLNNEVYHLKSELAKYQQNDQLSQIQDLNKKFNKNLTKKR
jgi:hypothetical protein